MEIDGLYDWESNTLIPIGRAPASADGVPSSSTDGVLSTQQAVISKAASEMPDTFHPQKSYTCHSLCELSTRPLQKLLWLTALTSINVIRH